MAPARPCSRHCVHRRIDRLRCACIRRLGRASASSCGTTPVAARRAGVGHVGGPATIEAKCRRPRAVRRRERRGAGRHGCAVAHRAHGQAAQPPTPMRATRARCRARTWRAGAAGSAAPSPEERDRAQPAELGDRARGRAAGAAPSSAAARGLRRRSVASSGGRRVSLRRHETRVGALPRHDSRASRLDERPRRQHEDAVGAQDAREPMREDQRRPALISRSSAC